MIHSKIVSSLSKTLGIKDAEARKYVVETPREEHGDYTITILMQELYKKDYQTYFKKIESSLLKIRGISKVSLDGMFVNIHINPIYAVNNKEQIKPEPKKIMIEFSSPNSNKPLHLGHVRNTILGDTLSNMLSCKYDVVRANLVNDRGIHICKSMIGYQKFSEYKTPEDAHLKSDHFVGDCYVLYSRKEKEDPTLAQDAERMLLDWEREDSSTRALWSKMNNWAIGGIMQTYKEMGIKFDVFFYESDIYLKGKKIVLDAYKNGNVSKNEKGYFVDLSKYNLPSKVVLRSDETSIYATQDLYLSKHKFEKYGVDKSIYCIGSEQDLYMKQLFAALDLLGICSKDSLEHFSYGMVYLPEGKMKSREGNVVDADDFIDEVKQKVRELMKEKNPTLPESELNRRVNFIAHGAIRYFILKYDPKKDITYEFDKSLSFEGNSGPYVMYTYARICSLISKIKQKRVVSDKVKKLYSSDEQLIARRIHKMSYKLDYAIEKRAPHVMISYITDLSNLFNSYYAKEKIITNKYQTRNRLALLESLKDVYDRVFAIIGIKPLSKM